jgi:TRAP transporter TAXI family solute receptor
LISLGLIFSIAYAGYAAATLITILTGGTNSVYFSLRTTLLSSIYTKAILGASVTAQATHGSVENLRLIEAGDGELAFTLGDTLPDAWAGNKEAGFDAPYRKLRAIAKIYRNFIQIVARDRTGIKTLADLKGKQVSVGAEGSGTELNAIAIFKAAGFNYSDLAKSITCPSEPQPGRLSKARSMQPFNRLGWESGQSGTCWPRDRLG